MAAAEETSQDRAVRPRSYEDKSYRQEFLGTVGDLQKAGVLQDVVLEVGGRRFPCHRLVLCAASPYFRAMFTGKMAESRQNTVVLQGLDPDMFEEILSYIYSGTLHVSLDNVQPLYQAADLLQVEYVRETCTSYMAKNVECSTCLDMYTFTDAFFVRSLKDRCLDHICRYFEKVSTSAEFCSLSVNQLTDIISNNGLDITEETTVWEAVVRWVEHSREERQHHFPSILPHIRFNLMSPDDMAAILEHPLVREDSGTSEVIRNVAPRGTSKSNMKLRAGMDRQEMTMIFSENKKEMHFMNPRTGKYIRCPVARDLLFIYAWTVTSSNDIYFLTPKISGPDKGQLSLLMYSHVRNVWEHLSSVSRFAHKHILEEEYLFEADGHVYYVAVIDGTIHTLYMSVNIRRYDQHTDQWLDCLQLQLSGSPEVVKAVSCGPHIYIFTDKEMHRYHPREDQWHKMATPNDYPYIDTVVATATEIFFVNQNDVRDLMSLYDTVSDSWKDLPEWDLSDGEPYHDLEVNFGVFFVLEGQLHTLAGYSTPEGHSPMSLAWQVGVLDRSEGVWRELKAPLPSRDQERLLVPDVVPVARMYLPCLQANGSGVQGTANASNS